ncbi:MAG: sulfatase [Akkermansiaceae bacterium]|nr:sulfatase [Akkermansiaceae bacterium]
MKALLILILLGPAGLLAAEPVPAAGTGRPNLVFILADDCTYRDMEIYGGQARTPHLKKLAAEGLKFTRCFQAAPMCSPTRHNIYTGLYPVKSGAWPNHTCVYPGTKSIAHHLRDAGYRVALSGKTHVSPRSAFPFEYSPDFKKDGPQTRPIYPNIRKLIEESKGAGTPFCLFACSNEPHTPYTMGDPSQYPPESLEIPPTFVDTPETRRHYADYLAEITYFDWQCGQLLMLLDEFGLAVDTLVMAVSEQGSAFPFAKWTCYEMGLASGMVVRWPGKVKPGTTTDALVEYVDVTPTFLDAAGAPVPANLDGKSFLPVLTGDTDRHKDFTYGLHTTRGIINGTEAYGIRSVRSDTHRYIWNLHHEATFTNAVTRKGGDKADFWSSWMRKAEGGDAHARAMTQKYQHRPEEELYDIIMDPHCTKNLAGDPAMAEIRKDLREILEAWMRSQGDKGAETEEIAHTRKAGYQSKEKSGNDPDRKPKAGRNGKRKNQKTAS